MTELTAHRTLALRDALGERPDVAFLAALHALCLKLFYRYGSDTCLELDAQERRASAPRRRGSHDSALGQGDRRAARDAGPTALPKESAELWDALVRLGRRQPRRRCSPTASSLTVNAVHEAWNRRPRALAHADRLAQAVDLDMVAAGWTPTVDSFLGRVTKARILQAVREAKGERAAERIEHLKKGDMAARGRDAARRHRLAARAAAHAGRRSLRRRLRRTARPLQPSIAESAAPEGGTAIDRQGGRRRPGDAGRRRPTPSPPNRPHARSPLGPAGDGGPFLFEGRIMADTMRPIWPAVSARDAEAVCRHYLSNGRREGRYWLVGDVRNTPGRSMFVRLKAQSAKGAAGKWTDAATGEHGDLLDVIRESCGLVDFKDVADEARRFLSLPRPEPEPDDRDRDAQPAPTGSPEAARRLFAMSQPIARHARRNVSPQSRHHGFARNRRLRFHPRCYYRPDEHRPTETWPAMIASVTDLAGHLTGAHRTWLDPGGFSEATLGKAPIDTPRRAMGDLLGHAVRFGVAGEVMAAGEGIETDAVAPMRPARPCRWRRRSRRRISPPSCSPTRCAGSTSPATTIPPVTARWRH